MQSLIQITLLLLIMVGCVNRQIERLCCFGTFSHQFRLEDRKIEFGQDNHRRLTVKPLYELANVLFLEIRILNSNVGAVKNSAVLADADILVEIVAKDTGGHFTVGERVFLTGYPNPDLLMWVNTWAREDRSAFLVIRKDSGMFVDIVRQRPFRRQGNAL